MSSVVISGNTSGTITLDAPAIAGTTVLTLPATTGNIVTDSATQTLTNKTLTAPNLGTPSALVGTNITGTANAFNAGIGVNQTWTNLTGSRSASTTYTNSTGKPIQLSVRNTNQVIITVSGLALGFMSSAAGSTMNAIIPNGGTYSYTGTIDSWFELR
jgi:hypothetical protein